MDHFVIQSLIDFCPVFGPQAPNGCRTEEVLLFVHVLTLMVDKVIHHIMETLS